MMLEVKHLSLQIAGKAILQDVSFTVNPNEFVGIIGPNGSGKSTLLKCIYRVLQPDCGEITCNGVSLNKMSLKESALTVAVVAQHNFYNFDFNVQDIVLMGRSPHKKMLESDSSIDYQIVDNALRLVGLDGMEERNFSTLSGGEQQRVILARALAQKTAGLILDEPTNHLDIKYQLQMMNIVKNLQCTTIAVIHDLNIAALYCDRLIAVDRGKVIKTGAPKEVLTAAFIKKIFGVNVKIIIDEDELHILYRK